MNFVQYESFKKTKKEPQDPLIVCTCLNMKKKQLLVCVSRARVGGVLAAEQSGVPHAAVVGVHVNLGPHAAGLTGL